ncbi:hypothetical protein DSL64_05085 [Dyadobacter luteus]|uniref:Lipocalin-like domain-containing protein n=1 Tax=Dyadobacter luteus TaxID=2259619 RepID=A0A3D8YJ12_9BACT|nr:hypothetical protein [Dyadobacter luteus]REA63800.1 hypothetical protein DSL64_05085 [Dyadobacter luteus]
MKNYYFLMALLLSACQPKAVVEEEDFPASLTESISGTYSGTVSHMEGNMNLGQTNSCAPPSNWRTHLKTGNGTVNIGSLADSTVKVTLVSSIFGTKSFETVVSRKGAMIVMKRGNGEYDPATKFMAFRVPYNYVLWLPGCGNTNPYVQSGYGAVTSGQPLVYFHYSNPVTEFNGNAD